MLYSYHGTITLPLHFYLFNQILVIKGLMFCYVHDGSISSFILMYLLISTSFLSFTKFFVIKSLMCYCIYDGSIAPLFILKDCILFIVYSIVYKV